MSTYGRLKIQCLYVAGTLTECPLRRRDCLREMYVSGGLTVNVPPCGTSSSLCGLQDSRYFCAFFRRARSQGRGLRSARVTQEGRSL